METSENCIMGMPDAALSAPPSFSLGRWGAWSVATTSMSWLLSACRSAALSSDVLMAGLHLMSVPSVS